jgi:hypothetical protein
MGTANSVSPLASPENEPTTSPCASAKGAGPANHFVPITPPPCRTCGMPMWLGRLDPLEPRRERRIYECLPCKDSVTFVATIP